LKIFAGRSAVLTSGCRKARRTGPQEQTAVDDWQVTSTRDPAVRSPRIRWHLATPVGHRSGDAEGLADARRHRLAGDAAVTAAGAVE
jgi:hypothetical protein